MENKILKDMDVSFRADSLKVDSENKLQGEDGIACAVVCLAIYTSICAAACIISTEPMLTQSQK